MDAIGIEIKEDRWEAALARKTLLNIAVTDRFTLTGDETARVERLGEFIREKGLKSPRIAVCLPRAGSISRTLALNATDEAALEKIIQHETEKYVPAAGRMESGFTVMGKKGKDYIVLFAAASRGATCSAIDALREKGLSPYLELPWQTCLYGALQNQGLLKKAERRIFILANEEEVFIEAFDSKFPVYSKWARANGREELRDAIEKGTRMMSSSSGAFDECVLISKEASLDELPFLNDLFSTVSKPDMNDEEISSPSAGAALSALGASSYAVNLMKNERPTGHFVENTHTALLGAGVLSMAVLLGGAVLAKDWYALRSMEKASSAISQQRARISALENSVRSATARVEALNRVKSSGPGFALDVLKKLTGILPGGAWITGLELSGDTVTIEGFAERPSSLVLLMEKSGAFSGIELAGPVTAGKGNKERFRMRFKSDAAEKKPL